MFDKEHVGAFLCKGKRKIMNGDLRRICIYMNGDLRGKILFYQIWILLIMRISIISEEKQI